MFQADFTMIEWIAFVVAIASAGSAAIPTPKSPALRVVKAIIDLLALNVAHARNAEKAGPVPKDIAPVFVVALLLALLTVTDQATAATLSGTMPTTRENGSALPRADVKEVRIYRAGTDAPVIVLTGAAIAGSTFSATVPDCVGAIYTATAIDVGALESNPSNAATLAPARAVCAPKPVTGLSVN